MQILIAVGFLIAILLLLAMYPGRGRREEMRIFMETPIAHRGLYDNSGSAPENSMAAYRLAAEKGYGIELDVQLTKDDQLVCMHDGSLLRATGRDARVEELPYAELQTLSLFRSEEHPPRFAEVLQMVGGRVPIIMEVKAESLEAAGKVSEATARLLDAYQGPICMESFHPAAVRWYRKHRPRVLRGQLAEHFQGLKYPHGIGAFFLSCCMLNFVTKPDFVAYNVLHRHLLRYRLLHDLCRVVCVAWTVKSEEEMLDAARDFEAFIFEGFEP